MEISTNQKTLIFTNLGQELALLREQSKLPLETVAKYANIKQEQMQKYEQGCLEFGALQFYLIMQWAAVFGKKISLTLEDFTPEEQLENYELIKQKLFDINRCLCG